ncbi:nascent polypeptide-associated complex subunit alpha, muscle-specific form-like [Schistocerca nitens]|uniref:nascent polypeptide-associated complex subunit alpha, muscle-specific form-like n=1 Tax=Schistocerca nitens TaxID=7011 RepID=UPI002119077E|nr:nascent polypeptide-associated complex subunit alpha, muscle-specific form-like [Schistocerca nitens]
MGAMGFPPRFIAVVSNTLRNNSARFVINGHISRPIDVTSSIRQGCPMSMALFAIAIEPLLASLMKHLQGLQIHGEKIVCKAYADDVGFLVVNGAEDCPKRSRPVQLPRTDGQDEVTWAAVALGASPARASRVSVPEIADDVVAMDVTPPVLDADSPPALPVTSLPARVAAPVPAPPAVDELPIVSDPVPAAVTLSVSEPVPEAAPSVANKTVSDVVTVVVDREERLDAPAEPKPRRERPTERADNVTRIRSASISGVSSRKARTPSPVVTCVPPYKSTSKQKKLQRASQRAVVDSRQASASDRRRQRPAACSQPAASVSSAESKRDEKVRQLKVLLTQTEPVVASDMAMDVVSSVSPAHLAGKRKSDDSHCRRIRPSSQDSGSDSAAGAGSATAAPSGAAVSMGTDVVPPPVFSSEKCDWAAEVEVEHGTGPDGQDEVTWAAVALGASPARARRVSDPEVPADAVAMDVTPSVPVADSSPALPVLSLPDTVEAPLPAPTVVDRIEPPIVSEPAPAAATLPVSEPVPEAASSVVTETGSAAATVVVDSEERLDAPAEPKPRRERPIERADNVPRFRSASLSGVSSRKGRTPSPVVTCVPPYKSTSKPKKLQRASQRAAVDSRQVLAADRRRQRPAAHSQPEASVSSAESKRDEKVRQLKVLLTQTDPVVTSGTAMAVTSSVSPGQVAGKRKSDDSHCRRIRPHSQDSGSDPPAGAGPATAAPSGAALAMETEVVPPPVFSSAKCDWAADVEVDEGTGSGT